VLLGLGWGELSQILALPQPLQLALDKVVEAVCLLSQGLWKVVEYFRVFGSWLNVSGSLAVGWVSQGLYKLAPVCFPSSSHWLSSEDQGCPSLLYTQP